jgi:guanylate kinase
MARRLEVARRELHEAHRYRHRVVNENVDEALSGIERILAAEGFTDTATTSPTAVTGRTP